MQGGALVPVLTAGEAQFYKLAPRQFAVELRHDGGCGTLATDLLGVRHGLTETAEAGFLRAGQKGEGHGYRHDMPGGPGESSKRSNWLPQRVPD